MMDSTLFCNRCNSECNATCNRCNAPTCVACQGAHSLSCSQPQQTCDICQVPGAPVGPACTRCGTKACLLCKGNGGVCTRCEGEQQPRSLAPGAGANANGAAGGQYQAQSQYSPTQSQFYQPPPPNRQPQYGAPPVPVATPIPQPGQQRPPPPPQQQQQQQQAPQLYPHGQYQSSQYHGQGQQQQQQQPQQGQMQGQMQGHPAAFPGGSPPSQNPPQQFPVAALVGAPGPPGPPPTTQAPPLTGPASPNRLSQPQGPPAAAGPRQPLPGSDAASERRMNMRFHCKAGDSGELYSADGRVYVGRVAGATPEGVGIEIAGDPPRVMMQPWDSVQLFVNHDAPDEVASPTVAPSPSAAQRPQQAARPPRGEPRPFTKIKLLGQGAQGQVWQSHYNDAPAGQFIVVKEMVFTDAQQALCKQREAQARRVMLLRHTHLISYEDVLVSQNPLTVSVVMPYYKESDLFTLITELRKPLDEYKICSLILQVALALEYMHTLSPPMIHRDVKPENILMFDGFDRTLLMDMDMSREVASGIGAMTLCGTFEYMAPETINDGSISVKSDMWSLGVVLYALITLPEFLTLPSPNGGPRVAMNSREWRPAPLEKMLGQEVAVAMRRQRKQDASPGLLGLLVDLLRHDPAARLSSTQAAERLQEIMIGTLVI